MDQAQMAYFVKSGWSVDETGTFLEKAGTNTIIVQFKYGVIFLVQFKDRPFDGLTPLRPYRSNNKNILYPCESIRRADQWAILQKKYHDGFTIIWWIQTQVTNKDGYKKVVDHRRRSLPGVMQHYVGKLDKKTTKCHWVHYNHVFIVALHKDKDWSIYDNEDYTQLHIAHIIKTEALRPMFNRIGEKLQTCLEPERGAKRGIVPDGFTVKKLVVEELMCDEWYVY